MTEPYFTRHDAAEPCAAVLILHGGKPHSDLPVDGRSASWRRMVAMQRSISPELNRAGVSTWLLRFSSRGWNGGGGKIQDSRAALEIVRRELGEVPVVLLGHSMGARTAVHVADDTHVTGVVALAPWFSDSDPVRPLSGRVLRAAHGRRDRITSFHATEQYAARARCAGAQASLDDMGLAGHYMLSHVARWNAFATEHALALATGPDRHH